MDEATADEAELTWYHVAKAVDMGFTELEEFVWDTNAKSYCYRLEDVAYEAGHRTHVPVKSIISEIEDYYGQAEVYDKWIDPESQ